MMAGPSNNKCSCSEVCSDDPPPLSITLKKARDLPNETKHWSEVDRPVDILLLTVEDCELLACYHYLKDSFSSYEKSIGYVYFGKMSEDKDGSLKVALLRCSKQSLYPGGSQTTTKNAVTLLKPKATFLVGLCYSLNPEKAQLGDVVISSKLTTDFHKTPVSSYIGNLVRSAAYGWKAPLESPETREVNVCDGEILSCSDLIDAEQQCQSYPGAIAAEIEGKGLFAAAHEMKMEWLVVKGVCAFVHGVTSTNDSWKTFACVMAASVVSHMLRNSLVFEDWPHYRGDELDIKVAVDNMKLEEQNTQTGMLATESDRYQEVQQPRASAPSAASESVSCPQTDGLKARKEEIFLSVVRNYLQTTPPQSSEEHNKFKEHLKEMRLIITGVSLGSLLITVKCESLMILEKLWTDYSSGHLGEVVQNCFVTEKILKELNLAELRLKTTMDIEEYNACKMLFEKDALRAEISWLSHHYVMHTSRPRGICLLINNVPNLVVVEEKLKNLFKFLSFDVVIKRRLQRDEFYNLARKFAKKNHTHFDTFVVIFLSVSDQCNKITCADDRNASLEYFMEEFTASRCPSLRGKPKLFFVQRFRGTSSTAEKDAVWLPCIPTSERDSCPEEADFLVVSVTSTYPADQPNRQPESLFIQILDQVIRCSCQMYHLLDVLTMVNKQMMDKRNDLPNIKIPYRTHTMRERVCLGSTPPSALITSAVAQQASYEMNKNPRGLCVIVNNVEFQNKDLNRPGADKDERSLQLLFKTLLFEVIIRRDLTKHELEKVAQDLGEANHQAYNAFVFIVMSHGGDRDCILGVDGRETTVKNLMSEFRENKCPSLKHKPKVFIIQTCGGCQKDADNSMPSSANDISLQVVTTSSWEQKSSHPCGTAFSTDSNLQRSVFPREADFVLATAPGYVSYRDPHDGAWFIQDLVEAINKYHRRHHFLEILTEVTRLVVKRGNSVQVPAPMDTLTKFLYL